MKRIITVWLLKLVAETPDIWAFVRNLSIGIIAAVGVINITAASASAPAWYTNCQWYILSVAGVLGFFAQSHQKTTTK